MDVKQQLNELFSDRESRIKSSQLEADAKAQAASERREVAITVINTTLVPLLREFERDIKERALEASVSIDLVSAFPGAVFTFHVPSTSPSVSWQASTLRIRFSDSIQFSADVWGRAGKSNIQALPTAGKPENADRDFFARVLTRFVKAVLDASE